MNIYKACRRERKINKRKNNLVGGKSVFTIQDEQRKRSEEIKKQRKLKEDLLEDNT